MKFAPVFGQNNSPFFKSAVLSASMLGLLLSGCTTTTGPTAPAPNPSQREPIDVPVAKLPELETKEPEEATKEPEEEIAPAEQIVRKDGLTPPHMDGRDIARIALVLPFSAKSARLRSEADALLKAAQMAVFDRDEPNVLLIALDSAGTPTGARAAVQSAVHSGADIILGPLLSANAAEAGREARKSSTPVISFSSDLSIAGNGVYLLSFPPEAEVSRVTEYAANNGAQSFAYLGPDSTYGKRVSAAYAQAAQSVGARVSLSQTYKGDDISVMQTPARVIADAYSKAYEAGTTAFDAIILPEGGTALRSLAPLLTYYEGRTATAQLLGTGLWNQDAIAQEPALRGGIFAAPDMESKAGFEGDFQASFNAEPSRLASLAYDGVNIAADVADGDPRLRGSRLTDPRGFYGVDGFVRFNPNGTPQRGLAIYEVQTGRFYQIDPAPKTAEEMNFQN